MGNLNYQRHIYGGIQMSHSRGEAIALIQNLYGHYAHALDSGDSRAFAATFAADGCFRPNTGPFQPDLGTFTGDALKNFVKASNARRPRHIMLNVAVDFRDELEADVQALFMLVDVSSGEMTAIGKYDDQVVVENGDWRFLSKIVTFIWQSPAQAARMSGMVAATGGAGG